MEIYRVMVSIDVVSVDGARANVVVPRA